jgi:hypothetical protein
MSNLSVKHSRSFSPAKLQYREYARAIRIEDGFGVEPEIIAKLARTGCRICEVGTLGSGRSYAEGKKISWKDGFRAIYAIFKYNIGRHQV